MMKLRKSRVTLAVGAVLSAAVMMPATSFGWSVDTNFGLLSTTSGGDTLLFPVYTTAKTEVGSVTTSFSVTNSGDKTIVAKIRFREQEKSMDVLDFFVVFSPYDNFAFSVSQGPDDERPTMSWTDTSCVVGPGASSDGGLRTVNFPAPNAPFVTTSEQMSVGHLEVLGAADISNVFVSGTNVVSQGTSGAVSLAAAAKHGANGIPANCQLLVNWLSSPSNVAKLNNGYLDEGDPTTPDDDVFVPVLADVPNDLVGRYVITGVGGDAQGIEGGSDAIGIRDSNLTVRWDNGLVWITAQSSADCTNCIPNPTGVQYAWAAREWDHPHLGQMWQAVDGTGAPIGPNRLQNFQLALYAREILGDWSNNPDNFVGVDWVLSFPSKYAYMDYVNADACAGGANSGQEWCLLHQTWTGSGFPGVWTGGGDGLGVTDLCLNDNQLRVYNREEAQADETVNVSPGSRTTLDVCQELQVFTLAPIGETPRDSIIQTKDRRGVITFENLDAIYGWGAMNLSWPLIIGDAMTGIIFTTRATEDPLINNGSITDLQKKVNVFSLP